MINSPDLSVIGVPKAGTTSIHTWLQSRDGINGAVPKETFFFMDDGHPLANKLCNFHQPQHKSYQHFFNAHKTGRTLDSTTHYLYSQTALEHFRENKTKVCVVLREPVSRLVSYFNYIGFSRGGFKSSIDFSEFVSGLISNDVDSFRKQFSNEREFFSLETSLDQGNYQKYLQKWTREIDSGNLNVVFFEDMVADRNRFLKSLAHFFEIEIEQNDLNDFSVQNESRNVKFPALNQWIRSAGSYLKRIPFYEPIRRTYHTLQAGSKIEFDWQQHSNAIQQLHQYYQPLNEQLFSLLQIDTNRWSETRPTVANSSTTN